MKKHVYMYSGDDRRVKLRINREMISDVIDLFGTDVIFTDEDDVGVTVSVCANERAAEQFAKNFAPDVILVEPKDMAEKLRADFERTVERYQKI